MFDFRIAYSGFPGLILFLFTQVIELFARKQLKTFLHN